MSEYVKKSDIKEELSRLKEDILNSIGGSLNNSFSELKELDKKETSEKIETEEAFSLRNRFQDFKTTDQNKSE
eukprot:CAMPEP_0116916450 /NCGR_PEP_ID=MMETSP0467-20121206/18535_1 /TAXON_ID=283647 /ORGANISM="Mesodinium pulex, Strain SPMC105" /LENGTH=72 /DNA_ID=CAMNT_0004593315 /DNA_START=709 /DNA_END=927 /DNA_ORIENTATION=-